MLDELHSISEHDEFELCELPAGCRPLPAKWVLKVERGAHGEIECCKARYVAKCFEQVYCVDFLETSAPLGRYATLRALLSVVWDLETKHIDKKCAFGVLHQDEHIVQQPMFHDGSRCVWKLKKALVLYELKQAAHEWHKALVLVELLSDLGFDRCHSDPALFVSRVGK